MCRRDIARHARFVEPKLVAEIAFRGWTRDGLVRQGSFKGLRSDKPAAEIVKETPMPTAQGGESREAASQGVAKKAARRQHGRHRRKPRAARSARRSVRAWSSSVRDGAEEIAGVRVTHPDRVLYPDAGRHQARRDRALSVGRRPDAAAYRRPAAQPGAAPRGVGGETLLSEACLGRLAGRVQGDPIREKSGSDNYLYIEDERGLVAAVQMGVLELHIWCCHVDEVEKPDRLVFDFDPDEGLDFGHVRAGGEGHARAC